MGTNRDTNYVKCNICGGDNADVFFEGYDTRIVKCKICGLIYNNPQIQIKKDIYAADYYKDYYAINDPQANRPSDYIQGYDSKKDLEIIAELKKRKPSGKILDLGCCFGFFLKFARQAGYETKGVEISDYAGSYARDVLGLDIFIGQLKEAGFADNHFDIIYMSQLLEHLPDPLGTLKETYRILKKDGILLIEAPNEYASISGAIRVMKFKERRPAVLSPIHLYYFSPRTTRSMLKKAGFKVMNRHITYSLVADIAKGIEGIFDRGAAEFFRRHRGIERAISSLIRRFIIIFDLGVIMRVYAVKDNKDR